MINEIEYANYWKTYEENKKKAKELFEAVKSCQQEFGWPEFKSTSILLSYARVKGLLSMEERQIIENYLNL